MFIKLMAWIRIRINFQSWIRISLHLQSIRIWIRNTVVNLCRLAEGCTGYPAGRIIRFFISGIPIEKRVLIEKGPTVYISRRPSHGQLDRRCCHQAFFRIFSEITYCVKNLYITKPKHYHRCVYFRDTTL
jgi:hypothetical protein